MPLAHSFTQKLSAKLHRSPSLKSLRAASISAPVSPSAEEVPPMPLDQFYSINFEDTVDPASASAQLPLSRTPSLLSKKSSTSHGSGSRSNSFSSSNLTNVPALACDSPSQASTESFPDTPTLSSLDYFPAPATAIREQYKKHHSRPSTTSSCTSSTTSSSGFIFIDEPVFGLAQAAPRATQQEHEEADEVALRILAKVSMSSNGYSRSEVRPVSAVWDI